MKAQIGQGPEVLRGSVIDNGDGQLALAVAPPYEDNLPWDMQINAEQWIFTTNGSDPETRANGPGQVIASLAHSVAKELMRLSQPHVLATYCVRRFALSLAEVDTM